MNQLCVPVPSATNTHEILEEVFKLCRIPWIYDFIFRADPAADISMLLAPVQKRHALSARIFVHATETSSRYAHTFDFNKELVFYSIPAFSIGPITAGFCVEQPAHLAKRDARDLLQCIRFIRDDRAGVFLHVSENERTGVTEVDCLTHKSSTRRTRVRMKFDLHSLRTVLRTARGILHPADIAPSLIYLNVSDEKRACPVCKDPTATHCECVLPLSRPQHPLDFQFEANNMGLYTGFYQGATVVRLCSAGHCVINATLQSGSVIQGELNAEITARMHKLAVADRLSRVKERPSSMVMPTSALDLPALIAGDIPDAAKAIAEGLENGAEPKPLAIDTDGLFASAPNVDAAPTVDEVDLDGASVLMDTGDMLANMNEEDAGNGTPLQQDETLALGALDIDRRERRTGVVEDEGGGGNADNNLDQNVVQDKEASEAPREQSEAADTSVQPTDRMTARGIADKCTSWMSRSSKRNAREVESTSSSPETYEEENSGNRKNKCAAVANSGNEESKKGCRRNASSATSVPNEHDKTQIRKQRNREAAARSNLKRKLRNESVRRDLASLTQRAIRLRVKEMMLRDENTRLRKALRRAGNTALPGR